MARRVHQADVERAFDQPAHEVFLETDLAADHDIVRAAAHPSDPLRQKSLPQGDASADAQAGAVAFRQAGVVARLVGGQHQPLGVIEKAPARGRQAGTGAVAHEQPGAEFVFQPLNPRADGRLGQVKLLGRLEKTPVRGDGEKGPGLIDIHREKPIYRRYRYYIANNIV